MKNKELRHQERQRKRLEAKMAAALHARMESRAVQKGQRCGPKTDKDKPYINSSVELYSSIAIIRHMMKKAKKIVGMTQPNPEDYYTLWKDFSLEDEPKEPVDPVEKAKTAKKLKKITSTFEFFDSDISSIKSDNALEGGSEESETEEMAEKRLSHSTKANSLHEPDLEEEDSYENESEIDADDEAMDYESDEEMSDERISDTDDDAEKEKKRARKKARQAAIAKAKADLETVVQEDEETKKKREAEIAIYMDIIMRTPSKDCVFLDASSGGTHLSDNALDTDDEKGVPPSKSSVEEEEETIDKKKKKSKDQTDRVNSKIDPMLIAAQKRKIEAKLKEAVQCRSAMGSYIPPKGKRPLTKYFDSSSPGPAAYYPQQKSTKGALMTPRWKDSIYETLGPGPGAYNPPSCTKCTATTLNLHESERFEKSETIGPGPGVVNISPVGKTGKDKPHALLVPRRPRNKVGCGEGEFTYCFGLSRRGKAHPPNALLISRHPEKDKSVPGPGAYDPEPFPDKRIGIIQKSRIPPPGLGIEPGYVSLPDNMGDGPKFTFGLRQFRIENQDTPGPIYKVPVWKRKPISLTFKPFPVRGKENDPSPVEYGTKVAEASLKVLPKAPVAMLTSRRFPNFGDDLQPAPNHYNLQTNLGYDGPLLKGRYKTKVEVLPGPADFVPNTSHFRNPPRTIISQIKQKEKTQNDPGFKYTPKYYHKVPGGSIYGRWKDRGDSETAPEMQDLTGMTRRGPQTKIPLSLHSRHTPFKHNAISTNANPPCADACDTYY